MNVFTQLVELIGGVTLLIVIIEHPTIVPKLYGYVTSTITGLLNIAFAGRPSGPVPNTPGSPIQGSASGGVGHA